MSSVEAQRPVAKPGDPCIMCGGDRKPERSRRYGGLEAEVDPFCSAKCARKYFGNELASEIDE